MKNPIHDGRLIIGCNSSAVVRFGQKIGSLEGEVIQLSPEEIEFIGSMHVTWVNRVIGKEETITVLVLSNNTASRNVVMAEEKKALFKNSCLAPVSGSIRNPSKFNYEGLADIILTYFILGTELNRIDAASTVARTVELVDAAITAQNKGHVADINPSIYLRGIEGLTASNQGFSPYLLAVTDRSRRSKLLPKWCPQ